MMRPRIVPVLLLDNRGLYKTVKFKKPRYIGDPINAIRLFNGMGVDEIIILDIGVTKRNQLIDYEMIKDMAEESFFPMAYGGGVHSLEQGKKIFSSGFEKVSVNSAACNDISLITRLANHAGSQSIVAAIDVKKTLFGKYEVYNYNTNKVLSKDLCEYVRNLEDAGAGEILINSVDHDGKMKGYAFDLIEKLANIVSVPLVACGGAGSITDMKKAIDIGAHAAAAGSLFVYYGTQKGVLINYPEQDQLDELFGK